MRLCLSFSFILFSVKVFFDTRVVDKTSFDVRFVLFVMRSGGRR